MPRKLLGITLAVLGAASLAAASPTGLSGFGFGGGGIFGDGSAGFIQGEFDFAMPPYVSLGPEIGAAFGGGTALFVGAEGRVYFIPNYNFIIQPHALFGGGYSRYFGDYGYNAGYIRFGGGMDFEIPQTPMAPYYDMGAYIGITDDGASVEFQLEGGLRFDVW